MGKYEGEKQLRRRKVAAHTASYLKVRTSDNSFTNTVFPCCNTDETLILFHQMISCLYGRKLLPAQASLSKASTQ